MSVGQVAVRYARALFQLALEENELDRVRSDMEALLKVFGSVPEIMDLIMNPVIDRQQKADILVRIFSPGLSEMSIRFIQMACDRKREEYLTGMARYYIELYKQEKGIKVAQLTSAVSLGKAQNKQILDMIRKAFKAEIELKTELDEGLIGGFVLRVEDRQLDASVKDKLNRIKKELQQ